MLVYLSDEVTLEVLKLQSVEEGRQGNYIKVDGQLDKLRYRVSELVMASVLRDIRDLQSNPRLKGKIN